jgi:hypothetical protein
MAAYCRGIVDDTAEASKTAVPPEVGLKISRGVLRGTRSHPSNPMPVQ